MDTDMKRRALEMLDGDEDLLRAVAELFLTEGPAQLEAVEEAVAEGDPRALEQTAHRLKGSAGVFGAHEVTAPALELENMGAEGRMEDAEAVLPGLRRSLEALVEALRSV